ncbi:MAG: cadherin-like domain-containing protein, partial [Bacteroidia bacterium]
MQKNYLMHSPVQLFFTAIIFLFLQNMSMAQVVVPFSVRYQATQRGGLTMIANQIITCTAGGTCGGAQAQNPPAGTANDNDYTGAYVDIDGDATTFSSSSADLNLPPCSEITWAGLYWGGSITAGTVNYANRNKVRFKYPASALYDTLTADTMINNTTGYNSYHCFKDITAYVVKGKYGTYTIADQVNQTGVSNIFGGWTIVIVYSNENLALRNLTVFNGLSNVSAGNPNTIIPISGFLTPLSGPVNFELGNFTYDGDRGLLNDSMLFKGQGGNYVSVNNVKNPIDNVFNSSITIADTNVTTRNPVYLNTLGIDADIFIPDNSTKNFLNNNVTSANIKLTTGGETFLTQVVTTAIDVYEPAFTVITAATDLNGGLLLPGDVILYSTLMTNGGSDTSVLNVFRDTIPFNTVFLPGSIEITSGPNAGAKTDAYGDDQADFDTITQTVIVRVGKNANAVNGGKLPNTPATANYTSVDFKVVVTGECILLQCSNNEVSNISSLSFNGEISGNSFVIYSNPFGLDSAGCPLIGYTSTVLTAGSCTLPTDTALQNICPVGGVDLLNNPFKRRGYEYYDSSFAPVTSTVYTSGTFYSIISVIGNTGFCSDTIVNVVTVNNCTPVAIDDVYITYEDTAFTDTLTLNDTDSNLDSLFINTTPVTAPLHGTLIIHPNGTFTYTPSLNYNGPDKFTYRICDNRLPVLCDTAIAFITVLPVNDAPIVTNDYATTNEDIPVSGNIFTVPEYDPDTTILVANTTPVLNPAHGSILINSNGAYTYTPNPGYSGQDTVVILICDQGNPLPAICINDTLFITVLAVNDPPVVVNDSNITNEDTPVGGTILNPNDYDPDGTTMWADTNVVINPSNGTIVINPDGSYIYTPDSNFNGLDTIVISVCDSGIPLPPICINDTLFITVLPVNDPPVAINDTDSICSGSILVIDVISNDIDIDGDILTLDPTVITPVGTATGNSSTGEITFDPQAAPSGVYTLTYTICDNGIPQLCDIGLLIVTVTNQAVLSIVSDSINNVNCFGDSSGGVYISVYGCTNCIYLWSNGDTNEDADSLIAGTYTLTVTETTGCGGTLASQFTVTQPALLSVSMAASINPVCFGDSNGIAVPQINGGVGSFTYLWNDGSTTDSLQNISAGTYTVTVTDSLGCAAQASVTLVSQSSQITVSMAASVNPVCFGDSNGIAVPQISG